MKMTENRLIPVGVLPPAPASFRKWLVDLKMTLQSQYEHAGTPYGATEAGFTQWLAEVAAEVKRQGDFIPIEMNEDVTDEYEYSYTVPISSETER